MQKTINGGKLIAELLIMNTWSKDKNSHLKTIKIETHAFSSKFLVRVYAIKGLLVLHLGDDR